MNYKLGGQHVDRKSHKFQLRCSKKVLTRCTAQSGKISSLMWHTLLWDTLLEFSKEAGLDVNLSLLLCFLDWIRLEFPKKSLIPTDIEIMMGSHM